MADPRTLALPEQLQEALDRLAQEAPRHFAATRARLGSLTAVLAVDGAPPVRVCLVGPPPWVSRGGDGRCAGEIDVSLDQRTLDALVAGDMTIEDGIETGRLKLRGTVEHLLACLDALGAWLHGALRSPPLADLQRRYLGPEASRASHAVPTLAPASILARVSKGSLS